MSHRSRNGRQTRAYPVWLFRSRVGNPPGTSGLLVGLAIFSVMGAWVYFTREPGPIDLDPQGKAGAFEPFSREIYPGD
jgi:hypothetical protein